MKLSQIATLLNETIVPNILGEGTTITEDLRNVCTLGKSIADLDADDLKDYAKAFALGVIENWVETRTFERETYGIFIDSIEYGGAVQRTRAKLLEATNNNMLTLESAYANENAPSYEDSKYWGTEYDTKIYTEDIAFRVKYSISTQMFKTSMNSKDGVQKLVALIENNAQNTLTLELNGLAKSLLRKLAVSCVGTREFKAITNYNQVKGYQEGDEGFVTINNWDDDANFKMWLQKCIVLLKKYVTDYNHKYNDGSVDVFCPEIDTRVVLLSDFATTLDFTNSSIYHSEVISGNVGNYSTINYWQNSTDELLPMLDATSKHSQIVERVKDSGNDAVVTIDSLVACIFDKYTMGITDKFGANKIAVKYVPEEDFTTYFVNCVKSYWLDTRSTGVIVTLS